MFKLLSYFKPKQQLFSVDFFMKSGNCFSIDGFISFDIKKRDGQIFSLEWELEDGHPDKILNINPDQVEAVISHRM